MYKILSYIRKNRKKIIVIVLAILLALGLIQVANNIAKNKLKAETTISKSANNDIEQRLKTQSIITNKKISETESNKNNETIKKFIDYCNAKDVNNAYSMLSEECRNNIYRDVDAFKNDYYNTVFSTTKIYTETNWMVLDNKTIYKVDFSNNILETGGVKQGNTFTDYVTVVNQNGEKRLNISSFVGEDTASTTIEDNTIKVKIISKQVFLDYEIYKINFINKSTGIINIYNSEVNSKWYITDNYLAKYYFNLNNISNESLKLQPQGNNTLEVKCVRPYNSEKYINSITFSNVELNEDKNNLKNIELKISK